MATLEIRNLHVSVADKQILKGINLTIKENEPVTPIHERNYGMYNSKMKEEGVSWRLSCNYENSIVIEKLNMYDTASVRGQVAERKIIQLNNLDEIYTSSDLKTMYLVPGERLK